MTDKRLLHGKIIENGFTLGKVAQALGVSGTTFSSKINNKYPFNTDQVIKICELLGIKEDSEKVRIFFAPAGSILNQ